MAAGRVELLYPFPQSEILRLVESYPNLLEVVWVQEEPNMGARAHMSPRLQQILPPRLRFGYVGRLERAVRRGVSTRPHTRTEPIVTTALDLSEVSPYPGTSRAIAELAGHSLSRASRADAVGEGHERGCRRHDQERLQRLRKRGVSALTSTTLSHISRGTSHSHLGTVRTARVKRP